MGAQQIPLSFEVQESYAAKDLLHLSCNHNAMEWIERFPNWPYPVVIIYGDAGAGKTHILNAWTEKTKGHYLAIDDANHYLNDAQAEEELFHQINLARENETYLLMAMDRPPLQYDISLPDLMSRLKAAPQIEITPPDDDDIRAILIKLFYDRQLKIEADVIAYIIPRIERQFSTISDLVKRIDDNSMAEKRAVTIPLVRDVLGEPQLF